MAPGAGRAAALVLPVLVGFRLQVKLHEHRMHDAPLYGPAGLLPLGALAPVRNTCSFAETTGGARIYRSRPARDRPGAATKSGVTETGSYVMDLGTLWRLAAHWYDGRLERGYVRREPSAAAAYLRGVGLAGPFWGL